jgi:hypothetical protein
MILYILVYPSIHLGPIYTSVQELRKGFYWNIVIVKVVWIMGIRSWTLNSLDWRSVHQTLKQVVSKKVQNFQGKQIYCSMSFNGFNKCVFFLRALLVGLWRERQNKNVYTKIHMHLTFLECHFCDLCVFMWIKLHKKWKLQLLVFKKKMWHVKNWMFISNPRWTMALWSGGINGNNAFDETI